MSDWRIIEEHDSFYKNIILLEIKFPGFWKDALKSKNSFYKKLMNEAEQFVREHGRGGEYICGNRHDELWHTHCDFCTEAITTKDSRICYATDDYQCWVCEICFNDFKERFAWEVK